jgi:unsaturated chondroitin disaccharide hydrolase
MRVDEGLTPADLLGKLDKLWAASAGKISSIERTCPPGTASPVFTVEGRYAARGWTEWTQGFRYGSALLQFDATGDAEFLELGRDGTVHRMAGHLTATGVHDHGFNNISTYGNLWRLIGEGRLAAGGYERDLYELALKVTGAVQAARWRTTAGGSGYIYSFNGPQSLFVDTIRSCRALAVSHLLGHALMGERDERISLLGRLVEHATSTAAWNVFYGEGRDAYDVSGRTAHEAIFNVNDGSYRCPSTQQGYSPFSTWTRGLAWAMLGFAELLEFLRVLPDADLEPHGGLDRVAGTMLRAATATCDFYLENTPTDGIPYWDTGAPGLARMGDYLARPAEPFSAHEPVDSSAAAIAAQGLLRLGRYLGEDGPGRRYRQAGLTVCAALFDEPYLSTDPAHQGLILHSVYHRPGGWDHVPDGQSVPCGEASMWGDYHARELALYVGRLARDEPYYAFFGPAAGP